VTKPQNIAEGMLTALKSVTAKLTLITVPLEFKINSATSVLTGPIAILKGRTAFIQVGFFGFSAFFIITSCAV
jgi:hypothetical protein